MPTIEQVSDDSAEPGEADSAAADPGRALLTALLRIPTERAADIRARTSGRRRPHRQSGPSADYGADDN